jgi:hypothetical protein
MIGFIPEFGVTSLHNAVPLTPAQKFHLFRKSAFDPVEIVLVGVQAGLSQAQNSFPEYGQGAQGYGKRYGAALADEVSSGFFANFFYPVLFKSDPRYFRMGDGPVMKRALYAVEQVFVAHTDSGGETFNFPNVCGAFTAGILSNAYYPASDRGVGLTMSRAGISVLYGGLGTLSDEFYPDAIRVVFHHHPKPPDVPSEKTTVEK